MEVLISTFISLAFQAYLLTYNTKILKLEKQHLIIERYQLNKMRISNKRRILIFISLLIIVSLGLYSKSHTGIGQIWVNDYSGDILYEVAWCLFIFWFIPRSKDKLKLIKTSGKIAFWVFAVTCGIEISQLWFYLVPEVLRSHLLWRLLLGAGFDWWDFPHYALGSLIGWWWIYSIGKMNIK